MPEPKRILPSHPNKPYYYPFGDASAGGGAGGDAAVASGRKLVAIITPTGNAAGYSRDQIAGQNEAVHSSGETGTRSTAYDSTLGWRPQAFAHSGSEGVGSKHVGNQYPEFCPNIVQLCEADRSGYVYDRTQWGTVEMEGYAAFEMAATPAAASTHPQYAYWGFFGSTSVAATFTIDTWTANNWGMAGVGFFFHPDGNIYAIIMKKPHATYPTSIFHTFYDTGVAWDGYIRHLKLKFYSSAAATPEIEWWIDGVLKKSQSATLGTFKFENENSASDPGKITPVFSLYTAHQSDEGSYWVHLGAGTRIWIEEPE